MRRLFYFVVILCGLLGAVVLSAGGVNAKSARYERFDVELAVQPDGSFAVTETEVVDFSVGPFTKGFRSIPTTRTEGITNIRVGQLIDGALHTYERVAIAQLSSAPNQFSISESDGFVRIDWTFETTYSGSRTFVVQYNVLGALRTYNDVATPNHQVWWTAVGSQLSSETPVDASELTVTLPEVVNLSEVVLESDGAGVPEQHSTDGKVFTWRQSDLTNGDDFTVRLQFPLIFPDLAPPSWQADDDAAREREVQSDSRKSVVHLMLLAAGLLLVAGGGTGAYGVWYSRGRDPHTGLMADFIATPPDDLPPGVAGTLVDERANECDIVATLLDLAHRGDITMTDIGLLGPNKRATGHDYLLELTKVERNYAPHELRMLKAIFGAGLYEGSKARLSEIAGSVVRSYPAFRDDLYQELVRRGYFTRSPEETRESWSRGGLITAIAGVVLGVIGTAIFDAFALIPAVAIVAIGLVFWRMGHAMPRKTAAGAEAAAKWRAFKRYLDNIERYENLKESEQIFDKYLPYTVAFGLNEAWVTKFAQVQTPTPTWFDPGDVGLPRRHTTWGGGPWPYTTTVGGGSGGGGVDMPDIDLPDMPDLQDASKRAGSAVQGGSSGLMDLLKVAGAIIEIASAFSGGGGRGGSSGGGGGGFS